MSIRQKVKKIFEYLFYLKGSNEKVIRNVKDYDKVYSEEHFCNVDGCNINNTKSKDWWISIGQESNEIYDQVFNLYENIQKNGENLEVVLGTGILTWKINGQQIEHPLFITPIEINFNIDNEKFYFKLNEKVKMNIYFLKDLSVHNYPNLLKLKEKFDIEDSSEEPMKLVDKYARNILSCLTIEESKYIKDINYSDIKILKEPHIYKKSLLIIKKADMNLWKNDIKNIINEIDKGEEIPKSIEALVTDESIEESDEEKKSWKNVGEDVLFPLVANEEQKQVIKELSNNFGVVVQGPPGTGKSHTIVNLICHLLAHGKRILVTSETSRALKVLKDKMPDEIKSLCISVLGNDSKSIKEIEESVTKIIENLSSNPRVLERELSLLKEELNICRKKQCELTEKLQNLSSKQVTTIKYCGEKYELIDVAKWLKENEVNHSWIEDKIQFSSRSPIVQEEFDRALGYIKAIDKYDIEKIYNIGGIIDKIPSYDDICEKISNYLKLKKVYNRNLTYIDGWSIYDDNKLDYKQAKKILKYAKSEIQCFKMYGFSKVFEDYYKCSILKESILAMKVKWSSYAQKLCYVRKELNDHNIIIPKNVDELQFRKDFNKIYDKLVKNGKMDKMFLLINKECTYITKECMVDYIPLNSLEQAKIVNAYLDEITIIRSIINLWNNTIREYENLLVDKESLNAISQIEEYMLQVEKIIAWNDDVKVTFNKCLGNIQYPKDIKWINEDSLRYLYKCLGAIEELNNYKKIQIDLKTIKRLLNSTKDFYGVSNAINNLDIEKLRDSFIEIERLKKVKAKVSSMQLILNKLRQQCPKLYNKILSGDINDLGDWNNAWKWRQWDCMLEDIQKNSKEQLQTQLENEKEKESYLIKNVIYKQTWYNQIINISEIERRSLVSWLSAVKRIGKGRGKYVSNYIKLAQKELENCKKSIPVWIMPINKLIENMKVSNNKFDVIICDESSQSNVFALCALMRAKRAVIVGDDKQISPEPVGVDNKEIRNLIDIHLDGIPHKQWFDLQTSFYDTALRVFPSRVMLKEHFRCVPEIIEFSNRLSYSKEIVPLRYAKKFERFEQPIKAVKVFDAKREGTKGINIKEAEAISEKIYECCNDKKYRGMTMGVISLLGEAQGDYIQQLLRKKIGEAEIIKRKIVCGDAYSFQGDERDIMFLSMVVANNIKFNALTKESDLRRFNVAASRAKNQMWVFHSIDLEELNQDCIRYSLLEYCLNYKSYKNMESNIEHLFYSNLQKDVYEIMIRNNYNIRPNICIGGHKIDFVIEGFNTRAAIICEDSRTNFTISWNDKFEFYLKLKYAGWQIIKIQEIDFYRNTEKVMNDVFSILETKGIFKRNIQSKPLLEREGLKVV